MVRFRKKRCRAENEVWVAADLKFELGDTYTQKESEEKRAGPADRGLPELEGTMTGREATRREPGAAARRRGGSVVCHSLENDV